MNKDEFLSARRAWLDAAGTPVDFVGVEKAAAFSKKVLERMRVCSATVGSDDHFAEYDLAIADARRTIGPEYDGMQLCVEWAAVTQFFLNKGRSMADSVKESTKMLGEQSLSGGNFSAHEIYPVIYQIAERWDKGRDFWENVNPPFKSLGTPNFRN